MLLLGDFLLSTLFLGDFLLSTLLLSDFLLSFIEEPLFLSFQNLVHVIIKLPKGFVVTSD